VKVVIATDKFKGSLSALQAARAMERGVLDADPASQVVTCPMADGGEGTVESVVAATGAEVREEQVEGPLPGQQVKARWAYLPPGTLEGLGPEQSTSGPLGLLAPREATAVIEMAQASGFSMVPPERRDPLVTTTFGTGQVIGAALDAGCRQIVVGVGGSATVDGGTGMARALGYRFLDGRGEEVPQGGGALGLIRSIDTDGKDGRLEGATLLVASDVDNPLVGAEGAAGVYGPQKGASGSDVESLDSGLANLGRLIESGMGVRVLDLPGGGAAGGLGAGLVAFCGAEIVSGVLLVASVVGLQGKVRSADLVLTGEGSYDSQTARGKTPAGVAAIAREAGVPAVIIAGRVVAEADFEPGAGVAVFTVCPGPMGEAEAMENAAELVRIAARRLMTVMGIGAMICKRKEAGGDEKG